MPPPKTPSDEDYERFEFHPGTKGFPGWGGVVTEGSPDGIGANRLRQGHNIRIKNGAIYSRQGLAKTISSVFGSKVLAIHGHDTRPHKLWIGVNGCVGGNGGSLVSYDPEQSPEIQFYGKYRAPTNNGLVLGTFQGKMYVAEGANLRQVSLFNSDYDISSISYGGNADTLVHVFTGFVITGLKEFDDKLFILMVNDAGLAGQIAAYDGVSIQVDLAAIGLPYSACVARENLVVGFDSGSNHIRTRVAGTVPGTWVTVAPGAGTIATYNSANSMIEYRDSVYIASGGTTIWKYDWATLAVIRTLGVGDTVKALAETLDHLFYGYSTTTPSAIIGKYDGDGNAWTDAYKNLTTQFSNMRNIFSLVTYKETLVAGLEGTSTSGNDLIPFILVSPPANPSGTWLGTNPGAAITSGEGSANLVVL